MSEDLSIDGPGSPVSLKKFLESEHNPQNSEGIIILLDQTGDGIAHDDPLTLYITPEECKIQALFFLNNFFKVYNKFPLYTARHLLYMYSEDYKYKYESPEDYMKEINNDPEHEDYKFLYNKFKYGENNSEFLQLLGLIQLFGGSLYRAKKENKAVRLYLQHPEAHLHPKRQASLMQMFNELSKEFKLT